MTNLRNEANGQPCMVRGPTCNYNPETTVLAHYRMSGISGIGIKSPDLLGAWACSNCHDLIDQRTSVEGFDRRDVQLLHLQGVVRTQSELIRRRQVTW